MNTIDRNLKRNLQQVKDLLDIVHILYCQSNEDKHEIQSNSFFQLNPFLDDLIFQYVAKFLHHQDYAVYTKIFDLRHKNLHFVLKNIFLPQ